MGKPRAGEVETLIQDLPACSRESWDPRQAVRFAHVRGLSAVKPPTWASPRCFFAKRMGAKFNSAEGGRERHMSNPGWGGGLCLPPWPLLAPKLPLTCVHIHSESREREGSTSPKSTWLTLLTLFRFLCRSPPARSLSWSPTSNTNHLWALLWLQPFLTTCH